MFVLGMLATHLFFFWSVRGGIARGDPDFTVFYGAAKLLREGRGAELYDARAQQSVQQQFAADPDLRRGPLPYIHPPFEALLFLPLTFVSYPTAFALWNLANLLMLLLVAVVLRRTLPSLGQVSNLGLVLMCLAFFPIFADFHQGQDAILLLLLVVLGFHAIERRMYFLAGCCLGLGVFKYHLIIPLVLCLMLWRRLRLALGFVSTASAAALVSIAIVGWQGMVTYPVFVWKIMALPGLGRIPARQLPNLMGLLGGWSFSEDSGPALQIAVAVCSIGLLVLIARSGRNVAAERSLRLRIACAVVTALLVGYSTNTYDCALLVLPLALLADYLIREWKHRGAVNFRLLLPVAPLLVSPVWFFLWMRWERINLIAVFLLWWLFAMWRAALRMQASTEQAQQIQPGP